MTVDDRLTQIASDFSSPYRRPKEIVGVLAARVSEASGIPLASILGRGREAPIARARQIVMLEAVQCGLSYRAVAYAMNMDHRTIQSGVRREQARRTQA